MPNDVVHTIRVRGGTVKIRGPLAAVVELEQGYAWWRNNWNNDPLKDEGPRVGQGPPGVEVTGCSPRASRSTGEDTPPQQPATTTCTLTGGRCPYL